MKVLDTTCLSALFVPGITVCRKGTTIPIKYAKERLELLINSIAKNREQIVIPAPVLSELLVRTPPDKVSSLIDQFNSSIWFRVESFDVAAAIELGTRTAKAIAQGDKREGLPAETPWAKVKFDRQIVAIAIVTGASEIISDDGDVKAIAERWGVKVLSLEDLEVPPECIPPPLLAELDDDSRQQVEAEGANAKAAPSTDGESQ